MTGDDLDEALRIAAQAVARDGAIYMPLFLRLEAEQAKRDQAEGALSRALEAARAA